MLRFVSVSRSPMQCVVPMFPRCSSCHCRFTLLPMKGWLCEKALPVTSCLRWYKDSLQLPLRDECEKNIIAAS
jgi:hypothetical protein